MRPGELPRISNDPLIFEVFYREHVEDVQRFVARRVSDPHLAADLTADVFVAAVDCAGTYRSARGTPIAWLFGIARVVVSAEWRRVGREGRALARIEARHLLDEDDITRMQERIDAAARARELFAAVQRLPEGERAVLELVALDELPVSQAAAALGLRPVTARVRLHRARATLRSQLFDEDSPAATQPMEAS